jgi:hypothetical protein
MHLMTPGVFFNAGRLFRSVNDRSPALRKMPGFVPITGGSYDSRFCMRTEAMTMTAIDIVHSTAACVHSS